LKYSSIGGGFEDEVDGFDVGDAYNLSDVIGGRFFTSFRMTRSLPFGIEDD